MNCPDENTLLSLATGEAVADLPALEAHLDGCARCRRALAAAASETTLPAVTRAAALSPGMRVDRYEIERELGRGGMGIVYQARDVTLDRRVAVKLLHARGDEEAKARLLREAQVMARLAHPNVVPVFELGHWQGEVYLVMELVAGVTLEAWLKRARHPRRDVLRVFLEAGRGLAAAHAAGVVHRDFKPANVLVGADERVRVTDFGLSRPGPALELPPSDSPTVTRDGAIVGTLAYMAPEQLEGKVADERSDQFSFCVSLVEALSGHRPFVGERWLELSKALARPPDLSGVPRGLRSALARGLAKEPARRFTSLMALVTALERSQKVGWKEVALTGVLAAVVVGGVSFKDPLVHLVWKPRQQVVCAARDLPAGAVVEWEALVVRSVPQGSVADAIGEDSGRFLVGQKLVVPVHEGAPLAWSEFEQAVK